MKINFYRLLFLIYCWACPSSFGSDNILLMGFWPPSNEMLRDFNPKSTNWIGKNWKGLGYNIYAFFPEFPRGGKVGQGDFRVDFAATYNDFFKYTNQYKPIAMIGFGQGDGPFEIETKFPSFPFFATGKIPSQIGVNQDYPVPSSLKMGKTFFSNLPHRNIQDRINSLPGNPIHAWIDENSDAGDFLCGFLGHLLTWYREEHKNTNDPNYNAFSGYIHVNGNDPGSLQALKAALDISLQEVISGL